MYKKYQLKNGMKVVLIESHKSPVLSIQMWVKTGSADEKKGEEGISHFIEHLVFKGTRKFDVGEIAATVEGAGGELNAYTSFDQTVFYVTISKQFLNVGLEVISEMMGFPKFDQREIDNEREVVIEEIKRSNDSPHRQASRLLFSAMYKKHPYGIPVIGYPENIKTVSRDVLVKYFKGRYNPQNMTLVVAGDFTQGEMRKQVAEHFAPFSRTKLRMVKRPKRLTPKNGYVVVEKSPFAETIVHLAVPTPKADHRDIAALEVFALILGQGESSRLNHRLRMTEHLVNYAGSSVFVARDPGFMAVSLSLNEKDLEPALSALQDELVRALSEPPTEQELRKAMTNLASEQFYNQETVDGLARNFGHYQDLFGKPDYLQTFLKRVAGLKPIDVLKAGRKYFNLASGALVIMTPESTEKVEPLARAWTAGLKKKLKGPKAPRASGKTRRGAQISFALKKTRGALAGVEKWTLKNGVTVITRPSDDSPVVSVRCASLGGSRLETRETQGATELLSRVWTAGAGALSEKDINEKCDELAASLGAFGGRNSEGLSMACLRPFLGEMLDLMSRVLVEPMFESTAVRREVKAMQEHVKLRRDNPSQLCILEFMKAMFGTHPYGQDPYGDEASIARLDQTLVRHVFRQRSGLVVVAAGAFDPRELRTMIQDRLGGIEPGPLELRKVPVHYPKKDVRVFLQSEKQQSHVIFGFPGLELRDPDRYALQVLQSVLAGQGGRLFVELRDKASLAYSVAPMRMEGVDGGYFGAYIGCSPEKTETALKMMREEFSKLASNRVPEEELERARRYLIGRHDIELQRNSNITSSILFDHIYGVDFMETFRFAEKVRAVDADAVRALSEKIFNMPSVTSLVGPSAPWA